MLIYHIKTQVKFDFGYNPLIFDGVMGLLYNKAHLAGASVSYGHISSLLFAFIWNKYTLVWNVLLFHKYTDVDCVIFSK